MSRRAKLTFAGTSLFAIGTVAIVHFQQKMEQHACPFPFLLTPGQLNPSSSAMHQGVVRDLEQQRIKRERQIDFEMQRALEEEYKKEQTHQQQDRDQGQGQKHQQGHNIETAVEEIPSSACRLSSLPSASDNEAAYEYLFYFPQFAKHDTQTGLGIIAALRSEKLLTQSKCKEKEPKGSLKRYCCEFERLDQDQGIRIRYAGSHVSIILLLGDNCWYTCVIMNGKEPGWSCPSPVLSLFPSEHFFSFASSSDIFLAINRTPLFSNKRKVAGLFGSHCLRLLW
ncbi:hypothetical protein ACRALDRAFT_209438 [Sodiomyces alcalophilus JCM 7366]|uniref:uncharacterized protein n=1 Tax=Sodiomyces alcalophilus JCM 7366 TaxID=591952 RepID=UPI0039B6A8A7